MKLHYILIAIISIIVVSCVSIYFGYNPESESEADSYSVKEGYVDPSLYSGTVKNLAVNGKPDANNFLVLNTNGYPLVVSDSKGAQFWQQAQIPPGYELDPAGQPKLIGPETTNMNAYIQSNPTLVKAVPSNGVPDAGYFIILNADGSKSANEIPIPPGYTLASNGHPVVMTNAEAQQAALLGTIGKPGSASKIIPSTGLDAGYYNIKNADGTKSKYEAPIPEGYKVDATGNLAQMTKKELYRQWDISKNNDTSWNATPDKNSADHYNLQNVNVQYHMDTPTDDTGSESKGTWVKGPTGALIYVPWSDTDGSITYNQPGTYPYGASSYVPSYEDSVYLSKLTNEYSTAPITDSIKNAGGFCNAYANDKDALEQRCNAIDPDTCASTQCCVLLGGAKCVAGNAGGPQYKSNYSDVKVLNKDFYYYQGKCYGNCDEDSNWFTDTLMPLVKDEYSDVKGEFEQVLNTLFHRNRNQTQTTTAAPDSSYSWSTVTVAPTTTAVPATVAPTTTTTFVPTTTTFVPTTTPQP